MTDDEFDDSCNLLLEKLKDWHPKLAKELTKAMNDPRHKQLSLRDRKVGKIRLLHQKYPHIFSELFAAENAAWAKEQRSDMSNFFYMLERKTAFLNPAGEQTGGNYTSKA